MKRDGYDGHAADVTSRSGFNVIELIVVLLMIAVFASVFSFVCVASAGSGHLTIVGFRGKEIFVSIISANIEREPLGVPSVWPSDDGPLTNAMGEVECFNFSNSTDYFRYLYDEEHAGTEAWSPFVAGFDYLKLAGAGVPHCMGKPLTAEYNAWAIAKNVPDYMDDAVPVLVTRNIDARSLASEASSQNQERRLYFDNEWITPFDDRGFIIVRRGGAIFKSRAKDMSYKVAYQRPRIHRTGIVETVEQNVVQRSADKPLKYLTPKHEVIPGDAAYAECRDVSRAWTMKRVKRELIHLREAGVQIAIFWVVPCLVFFAYQCRLRQKAGARPVLPIQTAVTGFFQCCAVILYTIAIIACSEHPAEFRRAVFAIATGVQVAVIAGAIFANPNDRSRRLDGVTYVGVTVFITILVMALAMILCWMVGL